MPTSQNQKMKLLYLKKILTENTDEQNPMSVFEIIRACSHYLIDT